MGLKLHIITIRQGRTGFQQFKCIARDSAKVFVSAVNVYRRVISSRTDPSHIASSERDSARTLPTILSYARRYK